MTGTPSPFATNSVAAAQRICSRIGVDQPMSDNVILCRLRLCAACSASFPPKYKSQQFCSHTCYSASLRQPIGPRFWAKVDKNGPIHPVLGTRCWLWLGALTGGGAVRYGQVMWHERYRTPQKAHRIAWELTYGHVPSDKQLNHHCDRPLCCNPAHIYVGSQLDNMRDASERGRFTVPHTFKLSLFQRLVIYRAPRHRGADVALAHQYGVTKAAIHHIRAGRFIGSGVWTGTTHESA